MVSELWLSELYPSPDKARRKIALQGNERNHSLAKGFPQMHLSTMKNFISSQ